MEPQTRGAAAEMSVFVVRAFVKMREQLIATRELAKRLAEIEKMATVQSKAAHHNASREKHGGFLKH